MTEDRDPIDPRGPVREYLPKHDSSFYEKDIEEQVSDVVELLKEAEPDAPHLEGWLDEALAEVAEVMRERGAKYGPGNIAEFGELGVLVRLSDKLARLKNQSKDFADESIIDTYMDIIGYALIGIAWKRGDWPGSEKPKSTG